MSHLLNGGHLKNPGPGVGFLDAQQNLISGNKIAAGSDGHIDLQEIFTQMYKIAVGSGQGQRPWS